jgi:hypothetical protein
VFEEPRAALVLSRSGDGVALVSILKIFENF